MNENKIQKKVQEQSEDEIIRDGLKEHTRGDIFCYVGIILLLIMIFIPPIFRMVFSNVTTEPATVEVVYLDLTCHKAIYREGYRFTADIHNQYRDSVPMKSVIDYVYEGDLENTIIPEVRELSDIQAEGVTKEQIENGYRFTLDFEHYPLLDLAELSNYSYLASAQIKFFNDKSYHCETTSETVTELVEEEKK